MIKFKHFLVFLAIISFVACKKEATTWNSNWKIPILKGTLSVENLLPNNSLINSDEYLSIYYKDTVYTVRIDTLIKLPDTTLVHETTVPLSLTISPGNVIPSKDINQVYDLGEVQLKRVIVNEGIGKFILTSTWPGKTKAVFSFPKLKDENGQPFLKEYILEAGSNEAPYSVIDSFQMANYDFDLTGEDGSLFNNVAASLEMSSAETDKAFKVTPNDTVRLEISFSDMTPKYAKGYFGEYYISDSTVVKIPELKRISGIINLDSIKLNMNIVNGFDLIAQNKITLLQGKNSKTNHIENLNFPLFNQFINLNPATGNLSQSTPSVYDIKVNNGNSSILPFIENIPDELEVGYDVHINPFGNSSAGNDQYFPNSRIYVMLDGELPLNIRMSDFTLSDKFNIEIDQIDETIQNGFIDLHYDNSFPISASAKLVLLSEKNAIDSLISSSKIESGIYDNLTETTSQQSGVVRFDISNQKINSLVNADQLQLIVSFNSFNRDYIKINSNDEIDFKFLSNLEVKINIP